MGPSYSKGVSAIMTCVDLNSSTPPALVLNDPQPSSVVIRIHEFSLVSLSRSRSMLLTVDFAAYEHQCERAHESRTCANPPL
jgi:hypothetical protein